MSSYDDPQPRNRFIPCLEPLEGRLAPVNFVFPFNQPPPPHDVAIQLPGTELPRTGGVSFQSGSTLNVGVAPIATQGLLALAGFALIVDEGGGNVAVSWDGQPFQFFSGVNQINLLGTASVNAVVFASLASQQQQADQVNLVLQGTLNALFEHLPPLPGAPLSINTNTPVPTTPF